MLLRKSAPLAAAVAAAFTLSAHAQSARDYVFVVGSSTVYPFSTVVAEQFGKGSKFKTPKVESTGTGGGIKLFCAGVGVEHPDVANASRRIKKTELDTCKEKGVTDVVEVKIGYDGIVLANAKTAPQARVSRKDIYLALAKDVPDAAGTSLVPNPYKTWKQVNPELPDKKIEVLGPPPTSGTRDAFLELVMEHGCQEFGFMKEMKKADEKKFKGSCFPMREDGAFIEAGENDNLIVQKLQSNPNAYGIFGFSFLDQNADKIQGSAVEGWAPTFDSIANGNYPVSRPLYIYAKKAHVDVIPGLKEYLAEFISDKAAGPEGYLADKGLIPLPDAERKEVAQAVKELKTVELK
jgi:phosphate transport system substrate-binding protein